MCVGIRNESGKGLLPINLIAKCAMPTGNQVFLIGNFVPEQMPQFLPVPQPQSTDTQLFLTLDLDWHLLRRIEEHRSGDVHFNITYQTLCVAVNLLQTPVAWGEPIWESDYVKDHGQPTIRVAQTDWLKILEGLSYSKSTVIEIETPPPPFSDILAEALDHLFHARTLFSEGQYEESMVRSRRAVESSVTKFESKSGKKLRDLLLSDSRTDFINGIASKTNAFLSASAHGTNEPKIPEPKNREDARLALLMSYAIVAYIATFLSRIEKTA
jgi:HEPN domain-containing protein